MKYWADFYVITITIAVIIPSFHSWALSDSSSQAESTDDRSVVNQEIGSGGSEKVQDCLTIPDMALSGAVCDLTEWLDGHLEPLKATDDGKLGYNEVKEVIELHELATSAKVRFRYAIHTLDKNALEEAEEIVRASLRRAQKHLSNINSKKLQDPQRERLHDVLSLMIEDINDMSNLDITQGKLLGEKPRRKKKSGSFRKIQTPQDRRVEFIPIN